MNKRSLFLALVLILPLPGCRWVDDFRSRLQPQYLELPERPTLNKESEDYKGDDTARTETEMKAVDVEEIDALSPIPEPPSHPAGQ